MVVMMVYGGNLRGFIFKLKEKYTFKIYYVQNGKRSVVFETAIRYNTLNECYHTLRHDLADLLGIEEGLLSVKRM